VFGNSRLPDTHGSARAVVKHIHNPLKTPGDQQVHQHGNDGSDFQHNVARCRVSYQTLKLCDLFILGQVDAVQFLQPLPVPGITGDFRGDDLAQRPVHIDGFQSGYNRCPKSGFHQCQPFESDAHPLEGDFVGQSSWKLFNLFIDLLF
jgi:hypothetical protein